MTDTTGMPLDLLLVRHGESEGNVALEADKGGDATLARDDAYRQRSTSDYRLSELGVRQALTAGDWIRNWMAAGDVQRFDRMYCSPFVRTRETAASLRLPDARWQLEPLLRERDWGLWEGRGVDETKALFPISSEQRRRNRFLWRPECGESTPDMDLRARDMLATFARELSGKRVICVTHEDTMWAFRLRLEKWTLEHWNERRTNETHDIHNCGILHYTRVRSDGTVADRFDRVRVIDPLGDSETEWETNERPLFSDDDLMAQVEQVPHLWTTGDAYPEAGAVAT
jgi:NAD+ kinase